MKDLIERLEKAAGPDRELDFDLHLARGLNASKSRRRDGQGSWWVYDAYDEGGYGLQSLPSYTASIDAALMLVPAEHDWVVSNVNGHVGGTPYACCGSDKAHFAATPVLSLCLAAMRARAQLISQAA